MRQAFGGNAWSSAAVKRSNNALKPTLRKNVLVYSELICMYQMQHVTSTCKPLT
jgi:hypothetical protein